MIDRQLLAKMNEAVVRLHQDKEIHLLCRQFLTDLSEFVEFKVGVFALSNSNEIKLDNRSIVIKSSYDRAFEERFAAGMEEYAPYDYLNWLLSSNESFVYKDSEIVKQDLRLSSIYYTEFLEKMDMIHACGMIIVNSKLLSASLALYRESVNDDFTEDDIFVLEYFLPHVEQAFEGYSQQIIQQSDPAYILKKQLNLTEREIEIVRLVLEGYTNKEISEKLHVQTNTIKKHIYNIFIKFDVSSRTQMFKHILQNGLLDLFLHNDNN